MHDLIGALIAIATMGDAAFVVAVSASQDETLNECATLTVRKKAPLVIKGSTYILLASLLETQGRGNVRPQYEPPASLCSAGKFSVGATQVSAIYAGFTKGMQTLLYRFEAGGENETREFLVAYSGMLSFTSGKGTLFHVTESRGDHLDIYAIFDGEPTYRQVSTLIESILAGKSGPMVSADWRDGEDELIITVFDDKRLN